MPLVLESLCPSNVKLTSSIPCRSAAAPKQASAPFAAPLNRMQSSRFIRGLHYQLTIDIVIESLCRDVDKKIVQDFIARMDDEYFATFPPEEIATHIRMSSGLYSRR